MIMFAFVIYMLQISRIENGGILYDSNSEEKSPSYLYYALVNQIFLMMGNFGGTHLHRNEDDFIGAEHEYVYSENIIVYLIFLGSVFVGQIVVFNMLIAIMA